jgi:hypothetical protein
LKKARKPVALIKNRTINNDPMEKIIIIIKDKNKKIQHLGAKKKKIYK